MDFVLTEKIRIGISACNYGAKVRWNQRGWDRVATLIREKFDYIWTPVCPEIMSGLGVPRPPIRLVSGSGDEFWQEKARMKNRKGRDVSQQIRAGATAALENLRRAGIEAFVFMEGSPSCGVYRTTLKDKRLGRPPGVFGSLLLKEDFFLIPADSIDSPWKWWDWSRRLHAFSWLKRREVATKKDMYDIWHVLKFMCQEADAKEAGRLGTAIAHAPKKITSEHITDWRSQVLRLLRKPSTLRRIQSVLLKHYAHYRRHFGYKAADVKVPESDRGKQRFIEELTQMERKAFDQGYVFAGHPVVYRPER